ncbi:MAG TPA: response regulator [Ktedonobacterales bacterium]|jgi:DNA-binding NtrC family response regulator|nr:response regulator [Ktedonobacterales bacterium]
MAAQTPPPVLIVDDDADIRETLQVLLESEGYPAAVAATSADALAHLHAATSRHIVLLDYLMPGANGSSLLLAVEQEATLRRHCYLLMTASPTTRYPPEDQRLITAVCLDILYKPFELDALLSAVAAAAAQLPRG